jgi:hypothetical protein
MTLRLNGSTSGFTEIDAPAVAGNNTITLPATSGTAVVNGANSAIVSGTAVASTSGTSIDFTGIPSWVKRVTVMFNGVSTNGASIIQAQLGSTTLTTSGYLGYTFTSNTNNAAHSSGFLVTGVGGSGYVIFGHLVLTAIGSNAWIFSTSNGATGANAASTGGGSVALSGTLDRVRITTNNGTDTFDAGSINILYE